MVYVRRVFSSIDAYSLKSVEVCCQNCFQAAIVLKHAFKSVLKYFICSSAKSSVIYFIGYGSLTLFHELLFLVLLIVRSIVGLK